MRNNARMLIVFLGLIVSLSIGSCQLNPLTSHTAAAKQLEANIPNLNLQPEMDAIEESLSDLDGINFIDSLDPKGEMPARKIGLTQLNINPVVMVAIDESESLSKSCDAGNIRYRLPLSIFRILSSLGTQGLTDSNLRVELQVLRDSSILDVYQHIPTPGLSPFDITNDISEGSIYHRALVTPTFDPGEDGQDMIFETFNEFRSIIANSSEPSTLLLFTDGNFSVSRNETDDTTYNRIHAKGGIRDTLSEIQTLSPKSDIHVFLICSDFLKAESSESYNFWKEQAKLESPTLANVYGISSDKPFEWIRDYLKYLLPSEFNFDPEKISQQGWGIADLSNPEERYQTHKLPPETILINWDVIPIYLPNKRLDFPKPPIVSVDSSGSPDGRFIWPLQGCQPHSIEFDFFQLPPSGGVFYWWKSENMQIDLQAPREMYSYNEEPLSFSTDITLPLLNPKKRPQKGDGSINPALVDWGRLNECFSLELQIAQDAEPYQADLKSIVAWSKIKAPSLPPNFTSQIKIELVSDITNLHFLTRSGMVYSRYYPILVIENPPSNKRAFTLQFRFLEQQFYEEGLQSIYTPYIEFAGNNCTLDKRYKPNDNEGIVTYDLLNGYGSYIMNIPEDQDQRCNKMDILWDHRTNVEANHWEFPSGYECDISWSTDGMVIEKVDCQLKDENR